MNGLVETIKYNVIMPTIKLKYTLIKNIKWKTVRNCPNVSLQSHVCVPAGGRGHPAGGGEAGEDQRCAERTTISTLQVQSSAARWMLHIHVVLPLDSYEAINCHPVDNP